MTLQHRVHEALHLHGQMTTDALCELLGAERRTVNAAVRALRADGAVWTRRRGRRAAVHRCVSAPSLSAEGLTRRLADVLAPARSRVRELADHCGVETQTLIQALHVGAFDAPERRPIAVLNREMMEQAADAYGDVLIEKGRALKAWVKDCRSARLGEGSEHDLRD